MNNAKKLIILGIETSCDETAISLIKVDIKSAKLNVLSNIISSQIEIHKKWGGVYPTLAKRAHQENLVLVLKKAIKNSKIQISNAETTTKSKQRKIEKILEREKNLYKELNKFLKKYKKPNIDLIAATQGPGLEPCLWVGLNFAKALSFYWNIPIIPINHIEAHILVNFITKINKKTSDFQFLTSKKIFPAVCLIASGGHTQLILMKDIGKYKIIGETRDDAAGECFDKCAKILGLEYPGGPAIAEQARQWKSKISALPTDKQNQNFKIRLPRPMINTKDYDFSFSGLKTAVFYEVKKTHGRTPLRPAFIKTKKGKQYIKQMSAEIQQAVIDVLIKKTIRAANHFKAKTIILGGGVSANQELKKQLKSKTKSQLPNVNLLFPLKNLSTDNALMTAVAGYFNQTKKIAGKKAQTLKAKPNLKI